MPDGRSGTYETREGIDLRTAIVIAVLLAAAVALPLPPSALDRMPSAVRDAMLGTMHVSGLVGYYCAAPLSPTLDAAIADALRHRGVVSCITDDTSRIVEETGT